jgi:uncharacterized membrane protein YccC
MRVFDFGADFNHAAEQERLSPHATRAGRATVAFMLPLLLAAFGLVTGLQAVLASFAAHAIASLDIRGAYFGRLTFFLGMTVILTGAAWLGVEGSNGLLVAVLATGMVALGAGVWRHLLGEYGFSVSASSALIFFIALNMTRPGTPVGIAPLATLAGCLGGAALHAACWPFMAQHPLRRAVAASWTAVGSFCEALPPTDPIGLARRRERIVDAEHQLRTTLDQAFETLAAARNRKTRAFIQPLELLNHGAAQLGTHLMALEPILDAITEGNCAPGPTALAESLRSVLLSLMNTTRSAALAVVSHQPSHLGRFEVRLHRLTRLLRVLQDRAAQHLGATPEGSHLAEVLRLIHEQLPAFRSALRATVERAQERGPVSYELFDLETWAVRPLASILNLSLRFDPTLVRFTLRLMVIMMAGTALWRGLGLPYGYWMPLCIILVLQPDYGATRARATQRTLGTLGGSFSASLILWVHPPYWFLMSATALVVWAFTFELKRDYTMAVFFITLLMVLQMEATGPVTMVLTLQRLSLTLAGSMAAILAALTFWPVWERDRLPPLLAEALRANGALTTLLCQALGQVRPVERWPMIQARRRAEQANSAVFSSLNRLAGDPKVQQEGLSGWAALANGNQRITRWLTASSIHLGPAAARLAGLEPFAQEAAEALDTLAQAVEGLAGEDLTPVRARLEAVALPRPTEPRAAWVASQLELAGVELSAMLLEQS